MLFWKKEEEEKPSNKLERRGLFLYSEKLKESMDEEEQQDQLCELMEMYQTYHDTVTTKQYVLRGSKMRCQFGTKAVLLDTQEDHGVYRGNMPVMTCSDCNKRNIHNFGSCRCPEWMYEKRLPMTPPVHPNGEPAVYAPGNRYPHICIPLVSKSGWQQEEDEVVIEDAGQVSPALVDSATLTCQYGGLIMIWEVPQEDFVSDTREEQFIKDIVEGLGWTTSEDEVKEIKKILRDFEITDKDSITVFLLLCISETGPEGLYSDKVDRDGKPYVDEHGRAVTEYYPEGYSEKVDYSFEERGVGYIQVTKRATQLACLKYLQDEGYYSEEIDENAKGYVEELRTMPWAASAWYWTQVERTDQHRYNFYVPAMVIESGGLTMGIVLATESLLNGKVSPAKTPKSKPQISEWDFKKMNDALHVIARNQIPYLGTCTEIEESGMYEAGRYVEGWYVDKNNNLNACGFVFEAPNNWSDFEDNFNKLQREVLPRYENDDLDF